MNIRISGNVKCTGVYEVNNNSTLEDILINNARGLKNNKRLSNIQVGGILGTFQRLSSLNTPVKEFANGEKVLDIIYLDEFFCPVDYVKFIMRYCVSTKMMKEKDLLEMKEISEKLVSNEGTEEDFLKLRDLTLDTSLKDVEKRVKDVIWELSEKHYDIFLEHVREHRCRTATCRRLCKD